MAKRELIMPETGPILPGIYDIAQKRESVTNQRIQNILGGLAIKAYPEERAWEREERERKRKDWKLSDILTGEQIGRERVLQEEALGRISDRELDRNIKISDEIRRVAGKSRGKTEFEAKANAFIKSLPLGDRPYGTEYLDEILANIDDDEPWTPVKDSITGLADLIRQQAEVEQEREKQRRLTEKERFERGQKAGFVPYGWKMPGDEAKGKIPTSADWKRARDEANMNLAVWDPEIGGYAYPDAAEAEAETRRILRSQGYSVPEVPISREPSAAEYFDMPFGGDRGPAVDFGEIRGEGTPAPTAAPPWSRGGVPTPTPTPTPTPSRLPPPTDPVVKSILDYYDAMSSGVFNDWKNRQSEKKRIAIDRIIEEYRSSAQWTNP